MWIDRSETVIGTRVFFVYWRRNLHVFRRTSKSAAMITSPIKNETVDCAIVRAPTRTMTERTVDVFHPGHTALMELWAQALKQIVFFEHWWHCSSTHSLLSGLTNCTSCCQIPADYNNVRRKYRSPHWHVTEIHLFIISLAVLSVAHAI